MIKGETYTIHLGNNLDILPTLPDSSVDSIVTDPPYELGFMGKKWDSSGIAYSVELWTECLRVLKPGGHLLSFGGTRTWHRVAVAIEDAGFEVRDSIAWMYGSGFPKSLDVSKAIDKGTGENASRQLKFTKWMRESGLTSSKARDVLFEAGLITEKSNQASHYFATTMGSQPAIATADMFDALRPHLPEVPEEIERLVAERTGIEWPAYKNREVTGEYTQPAAAQIWMKNYGITDAAEIKERKDKPSTPEAQQWEGWGTALKPAFEPIVVARKPLIGTAAENVLTHGTGALNIDGSRIGTEEKWEGKKLDNAKPLTGYEGGNGLNEQTSPSHPQGRWPANVILDEYSAEILDEQSGVSKSSASNRGLQYSGSHGGLAGEVKEYKQGTDSVRGHNDIGGASRFFYCAKASKRDRNEGLEGLPTRKSGALEAQNRDSDKGQFDGPTPTAQNFHPTVKPTDLMRYLIKLVTPPNGTVLDPFTGSGSTGKAAILEGFKFIGIEMTEDYHAIIEGRLAHAEKQHKENLAKQDEGLF